MGVRISQALAWVLSVAMAAGPLAAAPASAGDTREELKAKLLRSGRGAGSGRSRLRKAGPIEGEVLVRFKVGMAASTRSSVLQAHSLTALRTAARAGLTRVRVREGQSVDDAIEALKQDPAVEAAQPNFRYEALKLPNDPAMAQLWGLKNTNQTIVSGANYAAAPRAEANPPGAGAIGKDMGMEAAWTYHTDCSSVTVAVIDTGVNYKHQDLAANMWASATYPNHGYDFVDRDNDPMDLNGHGSHVAGTIGAVGNNGIGLTGVCWKASIMALRVLDATGSGATDDIAEAVKFAADQGAKVINMSLGGAGFDQAFSDSITYARSKGVLVVVAAGNDGVNNDAAGNDTYPCNFTQDNVICVAALNQKYELASFSNYGATSVDVGAPGLNIVSSWAGRPIEYSSFTNTNLFATFTLATAGAAGKKWAQSVVPYTLGDGSAASFATLYNPSDWINAGATYANNADERAYRNFDLTGAATATATFYYDAVTEANKDFVTAAYNTAGGDAFAAGSTQFFSFSGDSAGFDIAETELPAACRDATCSIGVRFTSNASVVKDGVGVLGFEVVGLDTGSLNYYSVIAGTSMATPHVAGLAAFVWSFNPAFGYADVADAIRSSGVANAALAGKTTTGKAVSAAAALARIRAPSGVTATPL